MTTDRRGTSDWSTTLPGFLAHAWAQLARGVADGRSPLRFVTLATHGRDGYPQARTVALRAAQRAAGEVAVHTDLNSTKIVEIAENPRASLLGWHKGQSLQLRLRGRLTVATGDAVRATWETVPERSRGSYGVTPAPGTPIAAHDAYTRAPDFDAFAVLTLRIDDIDLVHLAPDHHRRARFRRADDFAGSWRAP